jgi:hypothetical protein
VLLARVALEWTQIRKKRLRLAKTATSASMLLLVNQHALGAQLEGKEPVP